MKLAFLCSETDLNEAKEGEREEPFIVCDKCCEANIGVPDKE